MTKTIYYATTNLGKVNSLQRDLANLDVVIEQVPLDIPEPRSSDVEEIARDNKNSPLGANPNLKVGVLKNKVFGITA